MRDTHRVSAVVVVRNGERYLADALHSIAAQTVEVCEIVVVDGRSEDATRQVAAGFPGVRLIAQQGPTLPDAYNEAVTVARGQLLAFLDSL